MNTAAGSNAFERSRSQIDSTPPGAALMQLLFGSAVVPMIGAAAELGMFRVLAAGPLRFSEVAEACSTPADATFRLLRGLSAIGIVFEEIDGRFSLLPMGECLIPDVPGSFDALARLNSSDWCGSVYVGLKNAIQTGKSAFSLRHGEGMFEWLSKHPAERDLFAQAMSTFSGLEKDWVLSSFDFTGFSHIVDVGGGHGLLLSSILERAPVARGTLFDRPEVVATAEPLLAGSVRARCQIAGGSFFDAVPAGGDLYILKHVLHDWDDAHAETILKHVSRAMHPNGTVLIIEQGIAPAGIPNPGKLMDVIMLALVEGGRERTADEHAALMDRADLHFVREISTPGNITLFEGRLR